MDLAPAMLLDSLTRCVVAVIVSGGLYAAHALWQTCSPRRHPWE